MHLIIRRLLKLFTSYSIIYEGVGVSNNLFYAGGSGQSGWRVRAGIKAKYSKIFGWLIKPVPKLEQIACLVFFRSKHDCDNVVAMQKLLLDSLKGQKIVDDNTKHVLMTAQIYDPTLKHNTFEFVIIKLK
jgi:hypothetical protein